MTWYEMLVTYVVTWWLVVFMVLPFGAQPVEKPEPGHDPGAPAKPRLFIKFVITSVLSALITAAIYYGIEFRLVDFRPDPSSIPGASATE
ncbi:Predicted secreted protein [Arboricoccus pini]|uniref:Predicted secreted protein n=1 Tax=Arboricoccus pini TaxID=1963835 RepID=A0A212PWN0_9PROT|nr:DUF1467 family protein [Arboricoccus pini]SNB51419.1 Predicted secreted protein [Arboricoccus pini]